MIEPKISAESRTALLAFIAENRRAIIDKMLAALPRMKTPPSVSQSLLFAGFLDRLEQQLQGKDPHALRSWVRALGAQPEDGCRAGKSLSVACGTLAEMFHGATTFLTLTAVELEMLYADVRARREQPARADWSKMVHVDQVVEGLSAVIRTHDPTLHQHALGVRSLCGRIAMVLGVSDEQRSFIEHCGLLHDLGKLGIPQEILNKPGPLDAEEWTIMRRHPELGARILSEMRALAGLAPIVAAHHERLDGRGYPNRLMGAEIPFQAKIVAVADAFHAMINDRVYRPAMSVTDAVDELLRCTGTQFDPAVVTVLVQLVQPTVAKRSQNVMSSR